MADDLKYAKKFERKNLNSGVGVFFLFLKLPMTRRVEVCRFDVLYNSKVGCHRGSEAGSGRIESRYRPYFYVFLDTR